MKKCRCLSRMKPFGEVCTDGDDRILVNLTFNGLSLRFSEEGFLNFASMIQEASSGVIERGLKRLTK